MVWSEPLNLSWKEKHLDKTTPSLPVSKYHKKCEKHLDMNLLLYVRPAVDQHYPLPSPLLVKKIIQHVFNCISKEDWGAASVGANYKVIAWIAVPPPINTTDLMTSLHVKLFWRMKVSKLLLKIQGVWRYYFSISCSVHFRPDRIHYYWLLNLLIYTLFL